ncbi:MAG: site-specific DNA-methyltransferase, partial [Clostridiaceae bacterium]|nr:site-specific DNA-methyltransferase [Clostridiaceae bacterium]
IAANYNLPFDVEEFARAGKQILDEVEQEIGWMYETYHSDGKTKGIIEYTVWSEVYSCPNCAGEVVFLEEAFDQETKRVKSAFSCPHCGATLNKDTLQRVFETRTDPDTGKPWERVKYRASLISYIAGGKRREKHPDEFDREVLKRVEALTLPKEIPTNRFPVEQMYHGSRIAPKGFTHIHHFFLPRAAQALGALWYKANAFPNTRIRHMLLFFVEQAILGMSILNRYLPTAFSQTNRQLTGVYYVASQMSEVSPRYNLYGKISRLEKAFRCSSTEINKSVISTGTTARIKLQNKCIDYIFTDPPFGENIYYADLNYLVESWHRVITNAVPEAIVDRFKKKGLPEYQSLMTQCFKEYYRVLKPGRWMTVVFHNSRNAVWNAIQEGMQAAGFVVADVRTLDKQQGSYRQVISTAVKQDLVISAYRPNGGLEERFLLEAGTEDGVWDFIRTHLKQLPVFVSKDGHAEVIAERQNYMLFDRMVAFHVQRGVMVPMDASEFYQGLTQRFSERDGMFFLPEQVAEYDRKRMKVSSVLQFELFVIDESTAIQWLKQHLEKKPQTFQDLHPQFMKEIGGWQKFEKPLELKELLEQNFLCFNGNGLVPEQVHAYLSSNWKDLRNLPKDDSALVAKAKDRWYVPDPNKAGDLEKLREKALLREFEEYKAAKKKLKVFRLEAVRAGFKKAWQERDYVVIVAVADKIPNNVLEEDPKLLMWYDQAVTRMGGK